MRLGRVPRRYHVIAATSLLSLILVALGPSTGSAIPLLPEETSGSFSLQVANFLRGAISLSTPGGDAISVRFTVIDQVGGFGFTGASVISGPGLDLLFVSIAHGGQTFGSSHPSVCGSPPCPSAFILASMHADLPSPLTDPPTPFTGPFRVTVNGTFSLSLAAGVSFADPSQSFGLEVGFLSGSGTPPSRDRLR